MNDKNLPEKPMPLIYAQNLIKNILIEWLDEKRK
jgi:hypothetical protein